VIKFDPFSIQQTPFHFCAVLKALMACSDAYSVQIIGKMAGYVVKLASGHLPPVSLFGIGFDKLVIPSVCLNFPDLRIDFHETRFIAVKGRHFAQEFL
jgi:hypothetical protein